MFTVALALSVCGAVASSPNSLANLDFRTGTLNGWEGEGFYPTTATGKGPSLSWGVCSSDRDPKGHTALLHRALVVPPGAGVLRCTAYTVYGKNCRPDSKLDVVLLAAGKRLLPKQMREGHEWRPTSTLLPRPKGGSSREYIWPVSAYAGQTLRLALIDEDERPGCYLLCSGFQFIPSDEFEGREFSQLMVRLTQEQRLPSVLRYDSPHFMALSNAEESFTELRLHNCELMYALFCDHFRRKGFAVQEPHAKMMVAIFDSQAGFQAYLGRKMSPLITGIYHSGTNRLVVYDYGQNEAFVAQKRHGEQEGRKIASQLDRMRYLETTQRRAREFRTEANIGTIMHEVSHQLSFNCGLLNREGDKPLWLAEGLACYCEATDNGTWQGIGEANPERIGTLAAIMHNKVQFFPLRELLRSDDWLHHARDAQGPIMGYAQSWALFRMLMEERPQALRNYLALIYDRRTPDHRLVDFEQVFGADLDRLELRHLEYMKEQVRFHASTKR
jgi:hypothetical protein